MNKVSIALLVVVGCTQVCEAREAWEIQFDKEERALKIAELRAKVSIAEAEYSKVAFQSIVTRMAAPVVLVVGGLVLYYYGPVNLLLGLKDYIASIAQAFGGAVGKTVAITATEGVKEFATQAVTSNGGWMMTGGALVYYLIHGAFVILATATPAFVTAKWGKPK